MSVDINTLKTLQIVAIQHELAMSIGLHLDLDKMLHIFMRTATRRLGLRSLHIFLKTDNTNNREDNDFLAAQKYLSFPCADEKQDSALPVDAIRSGLLNGSSKFLHIEHNKLYYLAYVLPGIGFVILVRQNTAIEEDASQSLIPVFDRLAISCQACIDHQNILQEIDIRKNAEAAISRQISHDLLTGLKNRKCLQEQFCHVLAAARRHHYFGAIFFIDVDRFKQVNDTLGHDAGDKLLIKIADRLAKSSREEDLLARLGGDEFVIIASDIAETASDALNVALTIAEKIADTSNQPVEINKMQLLYSLSIGIALFPETVEKVSSLKTSCENLMKYADIAMYRAKQHDGSSFEFFAPEMQAAVSRRLAIEKQLCAAISDNELVLNFQPIIAMDGRIIAAEALLRWHNNELGTVSPEEFIPIAEESNLILSIGDWVLKTACHTLKTMMSAGLADFQYLSVNVSSRQFKQQNFVLSIKDCIQESGIKPELLQLEVTETAAIDNIEDTVNKMQALQKYGVNISLDDFGTGYSSLTYLHRLPLKTIKIDRSFISNISSDPDCQIIVDATIAMAKHLGLNCIAEGIETPDDLAYFENHPVYALQGYLFFKPMNMKTFFSTLEKGPINMPGSLVSKKLKSV